MRSCVVYFLMIIVFGVCPSGYCQEQSATELADALKENNALLKKQVAALEERLAELEEENGRLKDELEKLKRTADPKKGKSSKTKQTQVDDPFVLGSSWTGNLDGRDANGVEFHNAATAVIVSRDEDAFQIRATIQNVEWVYDCVRDKNVYRISKAVLTKAPANFSSQPGLIRLAGSEITTTLVKGQRIIKISVTRPIANSGVTAVYTMALDE